MIHPIKRSEIFKNPHLAFEVGSRQHAFCYGWEHDPINEDERHYRLENLPRLDCLDYEASVEETYRGETVIYYDTHDMGYYLKKFPVCVGQWLSELNIQQFYFALSLKTSWFATKNDYLPLQFALNVLESFAGTRAYDEAFAVDVDSLPDFLPLMFWLSRCVPSMEICFAPNDDSFSGLLCKYGNLHLSFYSEVSEQTIMPVALKAGLKEFTDLHEYDLFSSDGAIEGRQLEID